MLKGKLLYLSLIGLAVLFLVLPFPADPGNSYGLALGIAGTGAMVAMHGYTLRKKSVLGFGGVQSWLSAHIFLALAGPVLVLVHSKFNLVGIAGFAAFLMVAEAISGVTGRYIYMQLPRTKRGHVKDLEQIEADSRALSSKLEGLGVDPNVEKLIKPRNSGAGFISILISDLRDRVLWAFYIGKASRRERSKLRKARSLALERNRLMRSIAALDRFIGVMKNWRTLHIPVASVFYLLVALHILAVTYY